MPACKSCKKYYWLCGDGSDLCVDCIRERVKRKLNNGKEGSSG